MRETMVGPWRVRHEPELTRELYDEVHTGGAQSCGCDDCRNAIAARSTSLPREMLDLLDVLGVDVSKDAETVSCPAAAATGNRPYSMWYHFVGEIVDGPPTVVRTGERESSTTGADLAPSLSITLGSERSLIHVPLASHRVLQIEFFLELPWVLDRPGPKAGLGR